MKKYKCIFGIIAVSLIFIAILLISPVCGKSVTVNSSLEVINATDTSITWDVGYLTENRPLGAMLDGTEIEGFQKQFNITYTANELQPDTNHTFCLYGEVTINCEIGNTTVSREPINKIASIFYIYIWAILAIICLCLAIYFKIKEVAMVGFLLAFIGLGLSYDGLGISIFIHGLIMATCVTTTFMQE